MLLCTYVYWKVKGQCEKHEPKSERIQHCNVGRAAGKYPKLYSLETHRNEKLGGNEHSQPADSNDQRRNDGCRLPWVYDAAAHETEEERRQRAAEDNVAEPIDLSQFDRIILIRAF